MKPINYKSDYFEEVIIIIAIDNLLKAKKPLKLKMKTARVITSYRLKGWNSGAVRWYDIRL